MTPRHNKYYYLKYCFRAKKLVLRSESRSLGRALDTLSSIKTFIQEALSRGYDYLFVTNLPPQSFNADAPDSSIADTIDASISADYVEDPDIAHYIMSDFETSFLSDDTFDDGPARGMWDITSIYYSMMHPEDHDY